MVQNMTTSLYQTELGSVTVTWCVTLMGRRTLSFTFHPKIDGCDDVDKDEYGDEEMASASHSVQMNPWLFWKKKGSKKFFHRGRKARVYWDLSKARFSTSPEPDRGFYLCLVSDRKTMALVVGDLRHDAYAKTRAGPPAVEPVQVCRREHVFGKRLYAAKATFDGSDSHEITIECLTGEPGLSFMVDHRPVLRVGNLSWKFRGNDRFIVDNVPVQIYWDVHNWLFNPGFGHAVFMFKAEKTGSSSVSECNFPATTFVARPNGLGFGLNEPEKSLLKTTSFSSYSSSSSSGCSSSVLDWAKIDSDPNADGFCLVVYAWRR